MLGVSSSVQLADKVGDKHYVLQVEYLKGSQTTIVAVVSTGGFTCVQLGESGLRTGSPSPKGPFVTDVHSCSLLGDPHVFQTSSSDGFIRTWDLRTKNAVESYASQHGKAIYSCHCNGTHVAGGVGDELVLWDRRTQKTVAMFKDTHALDIVQVQFDESQPHLCVSASEDGNMAVFDLSSTIDEEDSFVGAVSINTSVSKLGLFGLNHERLWCSSGTESLHWWDWKSFCNPSSLSGAGVTSESFNVRENTTIGEQNSDYIVRCLYHESSMYCISGTVDGTIAIYPCHDAHGDIMFGAHPQELLRDGHTDVVRDVMRLPDGNVVSGGEDGRLCLWTQQNTSAVPKSRTVYAPY